MEEEKIRINFTIDKFMHPELFDYLNTIPKRKRAEKLRNDLEKLLNSEKNKNT